MMNNKLIQIIRKAYKRFNDNTQTIKGTSNARRIYGKLNTLRRHYRNKNTIKVERSNWRFKIIQLNKHLSDQNTLRLFFWDNITKSMTSKTVTIKKKTIEELEKPDIVKVRKLIWSYFLYHDVLHQDFKPPYKKKSQIEPISTEEIVVYLSYFRFYAWFLFFTFYSIILLFVFVMLQTFAADLFNFMTSGYCFCIFVFLIFTPVKDLILYKYYDYYGSIETEEVLYEYESSQMYFYVWLLHYLDINTGGSIEIAKKYKDLSVMRTMRFLTSQLNTLWLIYFFYFDGFFSNKYINTYLLFTVQFLFFVFFFSYYVLLKLIFIFYPDVLLICEQQGYLKPTLVFLSNCILHIISSFKPTTYDFVVIIQFYFLEIFLFVISLFSLFYSKFVGKHLANLYKEYEPNRELINVDLSYSKFYLNAILVFKTLKYVIILYTTCIIIYVYNFFGYFLKGYILNKAIPLDIDKNALVINKLAQYLNALTQYGDINLIGFLNSNYFYSTDSAFTPEHALLIFFFKLFLLLVGYFLLIMYYQYYYNSFIISEGRKYFSNGTLIKANNDVFKHTAIPGSEFFFSLLFSLFICSIGLLTNNILVIILCLECLTMAICYAILLTFTTGSADAAIKYFIISAVVASLLLYAASILYGMLGGLDLVNIGYILNLGIDFEFANVLLFVYFLFLLSFFIKLACYPFYFWVLDIYRACNAPTLFFLTVFIKFIVLFFFLKIFFLFGFSVFQAYTSTILLFLGASSIFFGSAFMCTETNLRRFIAFSSLAHFGYLFLIFACLSSEAAIYTGFIYTLNYVISNVIFFFIFSKMSSIYNIESLSDIRIVRVDFIDSILLTVSILSMAGIPPFLGFFSKYNVYILLNNFEYLTWYTFLILVISIPSYYGYFRLLRSLWYFDPIKFSSITGFENHLTTHIADYNKFILFYLLDVYNNYNILNFSKGVNSLQTFKKPNIKIIISCRFNWFLNCWIYFLLFGFSFFLIFGYYTANLIYFLIYIFSSGNLLLSIAIYNFLSTSTILGNVLAIFDLVFIFWLVCCFFIYVFIFVLICVLFLSFYAWVYFYNQAILGIFVEFWHKLYKRSILVRDIIDYIYETK